MNKRPASAWLRFDPYPLASHRHDTSTQASRTPIHEESWRRSKLEKGPPRTEQPDDSVFIQRYLMLHCVSHCLAASIIKNEIKRKNGAFMAFSPIKRLSNRHEARACRSVGGSAGGAGAMMLLHGGYQRRQNCALCSSRTKRTDTRGDRNATDTQATHFLNGLRGREWH